MTSLRRLDDRLLTDGNDLARHTPRLHGVILVYATYGLALFTALLHTVVARASAAWLWMASRQLVAITAGAALAMAFDRVYVAAHYSWDVAAGLALGGQVALLGWVLFRARLPGLTGWLPDRPGLRQVLPAPTAGRPPTHESTMGRASAA